MTNPTPQDFKLRFNRLFWTTLLFMASLFATLPAKAFLITISSRDSISPSLKLASLVSMPTGSFAQVGTFGLSLSDISRVASQGGIQRLWPSFQGFGSPIMVGAGIETGEIEATFSQPLPEAIAAPWEGQDVVLLLFNTSSPALATEWMILGFGGQVFKGDIAPNVEFHASLDIQEALLLAGSSVGSSWASQLFPRPRFGAWIKSWTDGASYTPTETMASADIDGDGLTNGQEYLYGLNPLLADSIGVLPSVTTGQWDWKVSLAAMPAVESSFDLNNWLVLSPQPTMEPSNAPGYRIIRLGPPIGALQKEFFRITPTNE